MKYLKLRTLKERLFFKIDDVADLLEINSASAKVLCSRYVKQRLLLRLKRNYYILSEKWNNLNKIDYFKIGNILQVPSYISYMTALTYYEVSTQIQQNFIESSCWRRSRYFEVQNTVFNYYKIRESLYSGFQNIEGIFIAEKEKAFLDCIYLNSFGKYKFDIESIDLNKLNFDKLATLMKNYPEKVEKNVRNIWKI